MSLEGLKLPPRLRAVHRLYFCARPLRQVDLARRFGVSQSAISQRVSRIRQIFAAAGVELGAPGRGLRRQRLRSLSGAWSGVEYSSPY